MPLDLTQLRHVLAVADTGSFSRAAEAVHISQPGLSRSIASFERQHGVQVFDRGRGGVMPTSAGRLVIEQARAMLATATDLERSLRLIGKGEAGRVSFGLGPMLASLLLPQVGQALLRDRPGLQISTVIRTPDKLLPKLFDGTLEMIFGNTWQLAEVPGVERERLGTVELAVIARGGHPLAGTAGLVSRDLVAYPTASSIELPAGGLGEAAGSFVCDNFHILRDVVLGSDSIWRTAPDFVAAELREGRMAALDVVDLSPAATELCVIFVVGRTRSPAASAVTRAVKSVLQNLPRAG